MSEAFHKPIRTLETVRTPASGLVVVSLCPVCRVAELRGRQTACSPACRRARSRRRQTDALLARINRLESLHQQQAEELHALRRELLRTP